METIAFDLDGTLIDVSERDYLIYSDILKELGYAPINKEPYWALRRAKTDIHKILEMSSLTESSMFDYFISQRKSKMEDECYLSYDQLISGVDSSLEILSSNYNITILTKRYDERNCKNQLLELGLTKYPVIITQSGKLDAIKSIDSIYAMVGDTENDILPAKELGIISVGVLSGIRDKQIMESLRPDYIINSVNDINSIFN